MATTPVDVAARYRILAAAFSSKVEAVGSDQWDLPSTCAEWNVRDLVAHVATTEHAMLKPVHIEASLSIDAGTDPAGAWREVRDVIQGVLDDPGLAGREYDGMFGTTTVGQTINDFGGFDLVVHGWDLAHSTGQDDTMPADEVERVLAMTDSLGDMLRTPGICGPEVPVGPDATATAARTARPHRLSRLRRCSGASRRRPCQVPTAAPGTRSSSCWRRR
jgi:uncharacterized protein (TIGR03086 family)